MAVGLNVWVRHSVNHCRVIVRPRVPPTNRWCCDRMRPVRWPVTNRNWVEQVGHSKLKYRYRDRIAERYVIIQFAQSESFAWLMHQPASKRSSLGALSKKRHHNFHINTCLPDTKWPKNLHNSFRWYYNRPIKTTHWHTSFGMVHHLDTPWIFISSVDLK